MSGRAGKIVVVGSSNTDMVVKLPRLPRPGETVLGGSFYLAAGGKGANQAVAASRAGGEVALVACLGEDLFGEQALRGFVEDGIDVRHLVRTAEAPSGVALIAVDARGENSIAVASGANALLQPHHVERVASAIAAADVLLMQLEIPPETVEAALAVAAEHGTRVVLNPAPARPLSDEVLRGVSVLTPNAAEAGELAGVPSGHCVEAASVLLSRGVDAVIVTLGAEGVYALTAEGGRRTPAFPVPVEDTTAAGDVFSGALAVALAEGQALEEAVTFASAAAALSVTRRGAQPSAPHRHEILELIRAHA